MLFTNVLYECFLIYFVSIKRKLLKCIRLFFAFLRSVFDS